MTLTASAPGKLFVLGEYAVLDGSPALVMELPRDRKAESGPHVPVRGL